MKNILTIDWEDWFHVCEVDHLLPASGWDTSPSILDAATDHILEQLQRRQVRATFFLVGYAVRRHPQLVRRIAAEGHELAFHTCGHGLVYATSPEDFAQDLRQGQALIRELTGREVQAFRAPQWSLTPGCEWALDLLVEAGFRYDSSRAPLPLVGHPGLPETPHVLRHSRGLGQLVEFPPLVLRPLGLPLPAGGGWGLRVLSLPAVVRKVRRLNAQGHPATFFFHPSEFVRHHFHRPLPLVKRLVLAGGLRPTLRAWDYLLDHLDMTTMAEAGAAWEAAAELSTPPLGGHP